MPSVEVDAAPLVEWSGDCYRLIPSRFPPVNVYEGLIANDRLEEVYAVENLTNPRLRSLGRIAPTLSGDAAADPRLQNWNLAPFAYGNPDGSLFFNEIQPCMEVSTDRQTALAVSVARREVFLKSTQEAPTGLDMRMLRHPVNGVFWDLRDVEGAVAARDEKSRREIGAKMPSGAQGIIYRSAERPTGTCISIVTGDVLERSQQTIHFRYVWDGHRVALLYVFNQEGTKIEPESLTGPNEVQIAA